MIKINLLTERKQRPAKGGARLHVESASAGRTVLLVAILALGVAFTGGWYFMLERDRAHWIAEHERADAELARLEQVRKKGEEYSKRKELLARKIELITNLKKQQTVPVYILDQVSRNLPDFLWLETMSADKNQVNIAGRATTYNAVSNFYSNLTQSGFFRDVALGRTYEVPEGVSFSLSCKFAPPAAEPASGEPPQG